MRYVCDNCNEREFKNIDSVVNHLASHDIRIVRRGRYYFKNGEYKLCNQGKYYCVNCELKLHDRRNLFKHISVIHKVCIWYEKGKYVYLDGLLR